MRFTSKWSMDKDQTTTPASHYSEDVGDGAYGLSS